MGRQQRNRHPANRLGRRRSARPVEGRVQHAPGNVAAEPGPLVPDEELPTHHRPGGQNAPHQS